MSENWDDYKDINASYVKAHSNNEQGEIVNPEEGTYSVVVEDMRLKRNKNGQPSFLARMRHVDGKYTGCCTFFNQTLIVRDPYDGVRIHSALEFLRSLGVCSKDAIQFVSLPDLDQKINTLMGLVTQGNFVYILEVLKNKKGYDVYRLIDKYPMGQATPAPAPVSAPAQAPAPAQQPAMDLGQRTFAANQAYMQSLTDNTPQPQPQAQVQPQQYQTSAPVQQQAQYQPQPQWTQQQAQGQTSAPQQQSYPNYANNPSVDVPF